MLTCVINLLFADTDVKSSLYCCVFVGFTDPPGLKKYLLIMFFILSIIISTFLWFDMRINTRPSLIANVTTSCHTWLSWAHERQQNYSPSCQLWHISSRTIQLNIKFNIKAINKSSAEWNWRREDLNSLGYIITRHKHSATFQMELISGPELLTSNKMLVLSMWCYTWRMPVQLAEARTSNWSANMETSHRP